MKHASVLLNESIEALCVREGGRYVDGTLGRGGHALEILRRGASVLGIDRDAQALEETAVDPRIGGFVESGALRLAKGAHGDIAGIAHSNGWIPADGVLLDLGVSSPQIDDAARGFSFMREGPLDMRMDRSQALCASSLVNEESEEELERIFLEYGEERFARRIARWICARRREKRFETTADLAGGIAALLGRRGAHHPATRVFQALRMAVNDEPGELVRALEGSLDILRAGGILAVISFESITDRIVKRFFASHAGRMVSLPAGGEKWEGEEPRMEIVLKKAVTAGEKEVYENPRARSAKLRAAKLKGEGNGAKE